MVQEKHFRKFNIFLFGVTISLGGLIFGMSISLFNNFFEYYMRGNFSDVYISQYDSIKSRINLFFSLGFLPCTLLTGLVFQKFGRRGMLWANGLISIIATSLLIIPNIYLVYALRFITGNNF